MNLLNSNEVGLVSGGEILISPGQIGIALTENSLVVVTGTAEASAMLQLTGAVGAAFGFGYAIGSVLVEYTDIENTLGGWLYNLRHC
jgi:hypothetical protein